MDARHRRHIGAIAALTALAFAVILVVPNLHSPPPSTVTPTEYGNVGHFHVRVWMEAGQASRVTLPCAPAQSGVSIAGFHYAVTASRTRFNLEILMSNSSLRSAGGAPVERIEWSEAVNRTDESGKVAGVGGELGYTYIVANLTTIDHRIACTELGANDSQYLDFSASVAFLDGTTRDITTQLVIGRDEATIDQRYDNEVSPRCPVPSCLPSSPL
jgi:hypothetical protein